MSRFLLAVWPFTGHVYPNIALAEELCARGHEVALYTGATARTAVEQAGLRYYPFRELAKGIAGLVGFGKPDPGNGLDSPQLYEGLTNRYTPALDKGMLSRAKTSKAMFQEWLLGTVPQQVSDLQTLLATWKPDVLVCDPLMFGPTLVLHETQAVPIVVFSYLAACLLPGPDAPPFASGLPRPHAWGPRAAAQLVEIARALFLADFKRAVNRMRLHYRLAPLATSLIEHGAHMPLYLVASVPEFDYQRRDLPASVRYVGPCLWDKAAAEPSPPWLQQLRCDAPIVYVTEGTANIHAPTLLRAAAQGLADLQLQVIMSTGRHRDPTDLSLGPIAANIRVEPWVPHSDLFPRANAAVLHGGSGTLLAALDAGLPVVVVPMHWDQVENAQRVADAGAGVRLMPSECTPKRLQAAVEHVLSEPSYKANAQRLAAAFRRHGGPAKAAQLLEQMIAA